MIAKADIRQVQEWMGHADIKTTMRYLHFKPSKNEAALVSEAFRLHSGPDAAEDPHREAHR
jgi:site-specific recombinase XerD